VDERGQGGIVSFVVTVLGSSGMFATAERACAGYFVEVDGKRLWMDAGAGTWRHLVQLFRYEDIDGVLLTHRHPDHVTDVFQCGHARWLGGPEPLPRIPLWAPGETLDRLSSYYEHITEPFDTKVIKAGGSIDIGGARLSFFEMAHPCETVGIRIEHDGAALAYSSDTGPLGDIQSLASEADLFMCEATLQDEDDSWEGHMKASQAAEAARAVGAKKLLLTHLPPGRDLGKSLVEGHKVAGDVEVRLASDLMRIEVGS
jgi:ribonuclease BN (tRNA processing enzyme)